MSLQLPQSFIDSICPCNGFNKDAFIEAHQKQPPVSIRLNPFKPMLLNFELNEIVPWSQHAYYLTERPNFTYDIPFQAGCYYVQEAGSMFIEHALKSCVDFSKTLCALDLCASPGGKSTLLNSLLNPESVLIANEVVKQRADTLALNLTKWGTNNIIVTNNDPSLFNQLKKTFDIILVDAPCSGSGLFRKQHDAINEWSLDNVNLCQQRQKRILSEIVDSLNEGGTLVYSTCSYSTEENEDIVDWLLTQFELENIKIPNEDSWNIVETQSTIHRAYGYRFYPDKTKSEGFFCALFKKTGEPINAFRKTKKPTFLEINTKEKLNLDTWIKDVSKHSITKFKEDYLLINPLILQFINQFPQLYYKKVGTTIGTKLKNDLVPHHDLALSIYISSQIQRIECSYDEIISFLKKDSLVISGNNGWNLVCYKELGLGWVKHLGNRINNYLPNEYRILK
ncbi:MAG: RNA methyltransferase [Bacteroidia bacterium]|nr:RNA methyltransferase [Bacteroidia bacterium]